MKLTFLDAGIPLTKTFERGRPGSGTAGQLTSAPYPHAYEFTSIEENCSNLQAFAQLLIKHGAAGHCLLKGTIARPLVRESRAGSTDSNAATDWIVFDLDGLPGIKNVEAFLKVLGLSDVSYVVQYSASYMLKNADMRAHVFMQLDKPMSAPLIKQWLIDLNHKTDMLRNAMGLTKTGNALTWPLDVTACQNDKLIYIAPPILKGGLKDPLPRNQRVVYVPKRMHTLSITGTIPTTQANKEKTLKRVNELREQTGLPARKHTFKIIGGNEVLMKPDAATITEMKTDRGFVYFNLNGGDSWAYYHPENNPDFIYNFKGEPPYLTKELLPEYWQQLTQQQHKTNSKGQIYLTFCDRRTGSYYRGTYDSTSDVLDLYLAKNETQVRHFAKQYGVPLGDYIPEWDIHFDPQSTTTIDIKTRTVNLYEPSTYMRSKPARVTKLPPITNKIITNALGGDPAIIEHFLNWIAFIVQYKTRTGTAWVLHGTEGTGKGLLINNILKPILGKAHVKTTRMEELNEKYNPFMKACFLVFVDEVQTKALDNEKGVMAKLRNFITEPTVGIREMHKGTSDYDNYTNWIFASNMPDPVAINRQDRRFNVATYQPAKLVITDKEINNIEKELMAVYSFLMTYNVDVEQAKTIIDSDDRQKLISIGESSVDSAASALLDGNFEFFLDQLPTTEMYQRNALKSNQVEDYKDTLLALIDRTNRQSGQCHISRDDLHTMFAYAVGNVPETPNKFTSMLKHHRIHMGKVWIPPKAMTGITVQWADPQDFDKHRELIKPAASNVVQLKKVAGGKK